VEELARRTITTPDGDSLDARPVTIDDAALGDERCGTRSAPATTVRTIVSVATTSRPGRTPARTFD
jgi:hypothetical protein